MEQLLEILEELHPEVDFETCDTLIDDKILDSFDIISITLFISYPNWTVSFKCYRFII